MLTLKLSSIFKWNLLGADVLRLMKLFKKVRKSPSIVVFGVLGFTLSYLLLSLVAVPERIELKTTDVAKIVEPVVEKEQFPKEVDIPLVLDGESSRSVKVQFTLESEIQKYVLKVFKRYKPDYGAFVALDAETGEVLALQSYSRKPHEMGNLALRASFPAASIFKIVTAAAAVDKGKASADTVIPYNGGNYTLFKRNVYHDRKNRWTRYMSLKEAFGRSINTVFGKLGLFYVGHEYLKEYAVRFGFNSEHQSDIPFDNGLALIADENEWSIAETASGYTRKTLMSPVQGALIASAVINDGVVMEPYFVRHVQEPEGDIVYRPTQKVASVPMDVETADELRHMMSETVKRGTARGAFRPIFKKSRYKGIEIGGKTGSLTGNNPRGKTDWFVGYVKFPGTSRKIAIASLTVHEKFWRVKSAYIARRFIEKYSRILEKEAKEEKQTSAEKVAGI